jgi:hypothetical protein
MSSATTSAHITGDPIGITHDLYTQVNESQCVYSNGNCSLHSFTFASANDLGEAGFFCAEIYTASYPPREGNGVKNACGWNTDVARVCLNNGHDGAGPLHCVDQDATMYKAGAFRGSLSSTLRRHVIY